MTRTPAFPPEALALVVAPMVRYNKHFPQVHEACAFNLIVSKQVDASDLPFRLMCIKGGATMTYAQMYTPEKLEQDEEYRRRALNDLIYERSLPEDLRRPVIVQLGGRNIQTMVKAARLFEAHCDGIGMAFPCFFMQA